MHRHILDISVFDALSIDCGPVAAVLLVSNGETSQFQKSNWDILGREQKNEVEHPDNATLLVNQR